MYVVVVTDQQGDTSVYGPFDDAQDAARFERYVSDCAPGMSPLALPVLDASPTRQRGQYARGTWRPSRDN